MQKRSPKSWTPTVVFLSAILFLSFESPCFGAVRDGETSAFALRYGQSMYDESELLIGGQKKEVPFAWYAWLVKTGPSLTLIDCGFLDAGLASRFAVSPWTNVKSLVQNAGFSPENVSDIILTHGHWDHMGGISDFPKARLWMARSEFQAMQRSVDQNRPWVAGYRWEDLENLKQAAKEGRLHLIKKEIKLKNGIRLEPVGGHTPVVWRLRWTRRTNPGWSGPATMPIFMPIWMKTARSRAAPQRKENKFYRD